MVVPLAALTEIDGAHVVFVVDEGTKTVRKTSVVVAATTDDGIKIAGGLNAGDLVVTAGVQFLRDGMRVRLPRERTTARLRKSS
jgi:membrane fusion protein, multidrug efflux system